MIVRALDPQHDWTFGRGKNDYLSGTAAVVQMIDTELRSFLGDCFFSVTDGIDWFNLLGSKNQIGLELALSAVILNTKDVTSLVQLSVLTDNKRKITITYSVNTVYTGKGNPGGTVTVTTHYLTTEDGLILTTENGDQIEA